MVPLVIEAIGIELPEPQTFVGPIAAPIITEVVTKFVPVAAAIMVGVGVLRRLGGK